MNEIFIFAELNNKLEITPVVFELSNVAQKLKQKLQDAKVSAVIINKEYDYSNLIKQLENGGFDKVYLIKNDKYKDYTTIFYSNALSNLIQEIKPKIVLFGATRLGRDLAPRISARLNLGLTADCTELGIDENNNLLATRPTFGGNLMATIVSKTTPQMATVRPNVFQRIEFNTNENIEIEEKYYDISNIQNLVEMVKYEPFESDDNNNLSTAKIVVAGGKGMKNKEGFALLKEFADLIGASVAGSRTAVEMNLIEPHFQVGQTGKTIMPDLYIACGISGAIQHITGMNMAKKVLAINIDKNAQIFNYADYGIVGDVFEILPKIIEEFKKGN